MVRGKSKKRSIPQSGEVGLRIIMKMIPRTRINEELTNSNNGNKHAEPQEEISWPKMAISYVCYIQMCSFSMMCEFFIIIARLSVYINVKEHLHQ